MIIAAHLHTGTHVKLKGIQYVVFKMKYIKHSSLTKRYSFNNLKVTRTIGKLYYTFNSIDFNIPQSHLTPSIMFQAKTCRIYYFEYLGKFAGHMEPVKVGRQRDFSICTRYLAGKMYQTVILVYLQ